MDEEPCLPDSVLANGNDLHGLSHVLITRGDTRRCTKKRSIGWKKLRPRDKSYRVSLERKERGLCGVSESARGSEACARQRYIRGGIIHSSTRNAVSGGPAALYILLQTSFAGSRQHASIHASPGPPHHRPTPAGTDWSAPVALWRRVRALLASRT